MGMFDSIINIGKGVVNGDWGAAAEGGAGLLDAAGPALASAAGQSMANGSLNSAVDKAIAMIKQQEAQDYARSMQDWEAAKTAQAANASAKRAAIRKAQLLQQAYYEKAQAMLAPYADAAKAELPIRANIYKQGMSTLADAMAQASGALGGMPQGANAAGINPKVAWK